ncbi:MAG: PaaI family thioesterase [Paracoccaceae bacterium]|jgi:uncharacterized protein (TIGR00369 family)
MGDLDQLNALRDSCFPKVLGLDFTEWSEGFVRARLDLQPHLLNSIGIVHGGVICSALDMGASIAGLYCDVPDNMRWCVTVSLTTNFVGQAKGGSLWLEGHQQSGGRSLYTANAMLSDADGTLIAHATGTFKWSKGSNLLAGVPAQKGWKT